MAYPKLNEEKKSIISGRNMPNRCRKIDDCTTWERFIFEIDF